MHKFYLLFCLTLLSLHANKLVAQQNIKKNIAPNILDSNTIKFDKKLVFTDSNKNNSISYKFNTKQQVPKRAAMYSALLPGLGQMYNKQYWKLPIVYGGLTAGGFLILKEYKTYTKNRRDFIYLTDGNPNTGDTSIKYNSSQLFDLQSQNRNRLDKLGVYTSIFYALNIVDALVSAHLKNFDISKDISLQCKPVIQYNQIGFAIVANKK